MSADDYYDRPLVYDIERAERARLEDEEAKPTRRVAGEEHDADDIPAADEL